MNNRRYSEALRGEPTNGDVALFTAKTDCIELTDDGEATVTAAIEALQHQLKRVAVTELKGDGADWPVKEPVDSTSVTEYLSHFSYGLTPGEARYTIYCFLKSNNMNIPKALKDLTKAAQFRINQNLDKMALFPCLISISGFDQPSMCEELHIPFIHNLTSGKRYVDAGGRLRLEQGDMDYYNVQYADIYAGLAADAEQPTTASLSTPNALKDSVPPMESNIAGRSSAGQRRTGCVAEESNGSREEPLTSVNSCHGCTRSRKDSSNGDNNTSNSNGNGIASGWRSFIPFRLFGHAKEKEKNGSPSRGTKSSDGYQRSRVNSDLSVSSSCCNSSLSGDDVADDQSTTSQGAVLLNPAATGEALAGSPYTLYADSLNFHGILGPIVAVITKHVPFAFHYWDREGHPIMYCRMDGLNSKRLMRDLFALTPINSQPRALAQLFNAYALGVLWQLIRYANIQSRKGNQIHDALLTQVTLNDRNRTTSKQAGGLFRKKPPVGSCVVVVDCAGLRLHRYLYKPLLVMIKSIVSLNVQLYPELLHHAYITNCRTAMSFSYLVIRSMLSEETRQKVTFCSRHNSASTLLENISSELLPQQLGGKCHCPGGCIPSVTAGMPGANQRSMRSDRGETRSSSMSLHSGSSSLDQTGDRLDELTLHRLHRTVERLNLGPHVSKTLSFAMDARTEIIWEFVVKRKQKVTFSAVFVSATDDGAMLSLVPRRRVQSDAGHYICPSYGTVILRWSNKRSYFRRCRVNLKVYREDQAVEFFEQVNICCLEGKMFYKIVLQRTINVKPADLCNTLNRSLLTFLREAVEGKPLPAPDRSAGVAIEYKAATKSSAMVIAVLDILNAETLQGKVLDDGSVSFRLTYEAMVLKLHRGEVVDLLVSDVDETGFWASVYGINKLFVNRNQMGEDSQSGGTEWAYEPEAAAWVTRDDRRSIKKDSLVRIRIIAETPQSERGMAVGTIGAPFLGPRLGSY